MHSEHPEAEWFKFLADGHFMLQRSRSTGRYVFYPRVLVPGSGESDLEWVPAQGSGTVYSTSTVRRKFPEPSYNVALIDLAEGPRIMSRVVDVEPDVVRIGMSVKAEIRIDDGAPLLVFTINPAKYASK